MSRNMNVSVLVKLVDQFTAPFRRVSDALGKGVNMGKLTAGVNQIGTGLMGVTRRFAAMGIAATGASALIAGSMIDTAAQFEGFETALTTIEGSSAKARQSMAWISKFAIVTPYEIEGVTEAFIALKARGFDPMDGSLRMLGDTASALNMPLASAVEMFSDATTFQFERLRSFGVTASQQGDKVTFSWQKNGKDMTRTVRKTSTDVRSALGDIFSQYEGAMDNQSRTFSGMMSNLRGAWTDFQLQIMQAGLFDWMKDKLKGVLDQLDKWAKDGTLDKWSKEASAAFQTTLEVGWQMAVGLYEAFTFLAPYIRDGVEAIGGWRNAFLALAAVSVAPKLFMIARGIAMVGSAIAPAIGHLSGLTSAFGRTTTVFGRLRALLGAGLKLTGVGLLIAAAADIAMNWELFADKFRRLWDGIVEAVKSAGRMISSVLSGDFGAAFDAAKTLFSSLGNAAGALADIVGTAFRRLVAGIDAALGTNLTGALDAVRTALISMWDGALAKGAELVSWFSALPGRITSALAGLATQLFAAGAAAIQGLWDGMIAKVDAMIEWVKGIPGRIKDAIGSIDLSGMIIGGPTIVPGKGFGGNPNAPASKFNPGGFQPGQRPGAKSSGYSTGGGFGGDTSASKGFASPQQRTEIGGSKGFAALSPRAVQQNVDVGGKIVVAAAPGTEVRSVDARRSQVPIVSQNRGMVLGRA